MINVTFLSNLFATEGFKEKEKKLLLYIIAAGNPSILFYI